MDYRKLNINERINLKGNDILLNNKIYELPNLLKYITLIDYYFNVSIYLMDYEKRHLQLLTKNTIKIF